MFVPLRYRLRDDMMVSDVVLLAVFMGLIQCIGTSLEITRFVNKHELSENNPDFGSLAQECTLTQASHFVISVCR